MIVTVDSTGVAVKRKRTVRLNGTVRVEGAVMKRKKNASVNLNGTRRGV